MSEQQPQQTVLLEARPRRSVIYASITSAIVVGVMLTIGILLRDTADGVEFRVADQVGVIGVGVLFGAVLMIAAARPRLRVTARGLQVRNMVGHRDYEWALVHGISFPDGAQWPELQLADDETYPVMAIQAMDRARAVAPLKELRRLFEEYAADRPRQTPEAIQAYRAELLRQERDRPLGRLEVEDLRKSRPPPAAPTRPATPTRPSTPRRPDA